MNENYTLLWVQCITDKTMNIDKISFIFLVGEWRSTYKNLYRFINLKIAPPSWIF